MLDFDAVLELEWPCMEAPHRGKGLGLLPYTNLSLDDRYPLTSGGGITLGNATLSS